jgi:hypothetical protein
MADALIENPILNTPFAAPARHFKFTDEGITNEIVDGRRSSSYFVPIARPKKRGKQLVFDTEWTQDRIEENKSVNDTINGEEHQYHPDFVAALDDGRGHLDLLNLIIEVTGEKKKEKAAKVMTARTLWIPAVNNHGAFGRWEFLEVTDPYEVLKQTHSLTSQQAARS